jgi:hypothetical protein
VRYNATRKVVLKGADAIVFVADSQREMREQNIESLTNMRDNLCSNNINPEDIPIILQYNKRDLINIASVDELNLDLNRRNYPVVESSAITGQGVEESFNLVTRSLLKHISKKHKIEIKTREDKFEVKTDVKTEEILSAPESVEPVAIRLRRASEEQSDEVRAALRPYLPLEEEIERVGAPEIKEAVAVAPERMEEPGKVPLGEIREVPAIPSEKIEEAIDTIKKINETVSGLQLSLSRLTEEMRGIEQMKKEQQTSNSILREIASLLQDIKSKKGMFKFW